MSTNAKSSQPRPIYAVVWTWRKWRVTPTKKEAQRRQKIWKRWYERQGWKVAAWGEDTYVATSQATGERHACLVHTYDRETRQRIYPKVRAKVERPAVEKKPRRGRKPVGA